MLSKIFSTVALAILLLAHGAVSAPQVSTPGSHAPCPNKGEICCKPLTLPQLPKGTSHQWDTRWDGNVPNVFWISSLHMYIMLNLLVGQAFPKQPSIRVTPTFNETMSSPAPSAKRMPRPEVANP
ncbi:hypothetical protein C8J57DRAFT_1229474 [Mycena rebaudengoi]|nr:hypothetical protein C8J57DRAFT_1232427 [Mycena rebaudengoi]KAJ7266065.1 hypothetical protein C8J57DRAFT_1229474 [Mycena rebaudengoi]